MLTPQQFGAIGNGGSHPLSGVYPSLAAAQTVYPFAGALTDELDWCGIQKAVDTARYQWQTPDSDFQIGKTVAIPAGIYRINKTVQIKDMFGFALAGVNGMPQIKWYGDASSPMFLLGNCDSCRMENLWLYHGSSSANSVLSAVDLQNGGNASTWGPTNWTFRHIHVGGFNLGTFQYCFRILGASGTGGDANNEYHRWERCNFRSYSEAGLLILDATQAHQLVLTDCGIQGDSTGKCGIRNTGVITRLILERCAGGAHTQYDFDFTNNAAHQVTIDQWNSENSARLCQLGTGLFGSPAMLRITNCRWESPSNIAADGYIVRGWGPGPLVFTGNQIASNVVGRQPKVKWTGVATGPSSTLIFECNRFDDTGQDYSADAYDVTDTTVRKAGNYYWDAGDNKYITFA